MRRSKSRVIGRLTAEFTVIVLGVLVALAADRWNQGRVERDLAADYSVRLLVELTADSVRLEERRQQAIESASSGLILLELMQSTEPDTTARQLQRACGGGRLPHPGGATFSEIQNTGSLGLLHPDVRQLLFDYYGYAEGTLGRMEAARPTLRDPINVAGAKSGAWMPREMVSLFEFTERLRAYPDIGGIVMGCVAYQRGAAAVRLGQWVRRLGEVLEVLRVSSAE